MEFINDKSFSTFVEERPQEAQVANQPVQRTNGGFRFAPAPIRR